MSRDIEKLRILSQRAARYTSLGEARQAQRNSIELTIDLPMTEIISRAQTISAIDQRLIRIKKITDGLNSQAESQDQRIRDGLSTLAPLAETNPTVAAIYEPLKAEYDAFKEGPHTKMEEQTNPVKQNVTSENQDSTNKDSRSYEKTAKKDIYSKGVFGIELPNGRKAEIKGGLCNAIIDAYYRGLRDRDEIASDIYLEGATDQTRERVSKGVSNLNLQLEKHNSRFAKPSQKELRDGHPYTYTWESDEQGDQSPVEESAATSKITNYEAAVISYVLSWDEVVKEFDAKGISLLDPYWVQQAIESVEERGSVSQTDLDALRENIILKLTKMIEEEDVNEIARNVGPNAENLLTYCMIGLGERRNEAFEIVLKHLDEDRKRIKGRDAVRAIYSGGSLYHIAGPNDATIPLPSAVDRWDKIRVAQERTVAITRADTPSGQQTIIETTLKETEERSSTVSVVYDASTEDRPRPVIAVLEADETGLTTSERQMPKAKNERILESYPDLYERDPRFIERFEAAMAEMLKQFPSLQRDATGAINGKQVAAASNIGIAFILKAIGARYLELDGSRSKPKYKPVGLLTLTYLKHFPDLNFNPASKRQLRDYAGILIDGLVRSQQAANK